MFISPAVRGPEVLSPPGLPQMLPWDFPLVVPFYVSSNFSLFPTQATCPVPKFPVGMRSLHSFACSVVAPCSSWWPLAYNDAQIRPAALPVAGGSRL
jgi:hypothetical protein